jgi:uncharacterized peroxidase-related enzyme
MAEVVSDNHQRHSGRISRLSVPTENSVPNETAQLVERHGGDNWIRSLSLNPATARLFAQYFEQLFSGDDHSLPLAERELIAVIVSSTNGCGLCTIHHTHALGDALDDPAQAQRIALDYHLAKLSPRSLALAELAETITRSPRQIGTAHFDTLRAAGLSDAAILEAVETASWFNHTNRIFIATGVVPDDKYFGAPA